MSPISHTASRLIRASPDAVYEAFLDPEMVSRWMPPHGSTMEIQVYEPHAGGSFRMVLTFAASPGKSSAKFDVVEGQFVILVPGKRIVQAIKFVSDDADFGGTMTMTWNLDEVPDGTNVTVSARDVPRGIDQADHEAGMTSTLENLAAVLE